MSVDFTQLRAAIRQATERAFTDLRAAHPDEHFYAFALSTDESLMTVVPAANSEEAWQRKVAEDAGGIAAPPSYYRWALGEWGYEGAGGEHFQAAEALLTAPDRFEGEDDVDLDAEDWDAEPSPEEAEFQREVLTAMAAALADLDAEGFFGTGDARAQVTLFVSISDSDEALEAETESAQRLNPEPVAQAFAQRYATTP